MNKYLKKAIAFLMVLTMAAASVIIVSAASPDGQAPPSTAAVAAEPTPIDLGMIPLRIFFEESVGATVAWDNDDRSIHIFIGEDTVVIFTAQPIGIVGDIVVEMEHGVVIWQDMAFITEADLMRLFHASLGELEMAVFYLTEEARDLALYDFDHMVALILENSVWDNIIYRRLGIPFDAFAAHHRAYIENMVPQEWPVLPQYVPFRDCDEPRSLAANYLANLLIFEFAFPLQGIGHLGMREIPLYQIQAGALIRLFNNADVDMSHSFVDQLMHAAFTHPDAVWFYGEVDVDFEAGAGAFPEVPGNIVTEIIVPGQVAYLGIRSFVACRVFDDLTTLPFLQQVQDFDHLIIDVRGNPGGDMNYFAPAIFQRLISDTMEIRHHEFFTSGEVATRWVDAWLRTVQHLDIEGVYVDIVPARSFAADNGLDMINPADLARFSYAFVTAATVGPADDGINFGGQVWLLVDGGSASASVGAALLAQSSGFATVVGTPTSGVMNPVHSYNVLPNTGIIWRIDIGHFTDAYGRSVEEMGVIPDVLNLPGMDAIETVLAIIAGE